MSLLIGSRRCDGIGTVAGFLCGHALQTAFQQRQWSDEQPHQNVKEGRGDIWRIVCVKKKKTYCTIKAALLCVWTKNMKFILFIPYPWCYICWKSSGLFRSCGSVKRDLSAESDCCWTLSNNTSWNTVQSRLIQAWRFLIFFHQVFLHYRTWKDTTEANCLDIFEPCACGVFHRTSDRQKTPFRQLKQMKTPHWSFQDLPFQDTLYLPSWTQETADQEYLSRCAPREKDKSTSRSTLWTGTSTSLIRIKMYIVLLMQRFCLNQPHPCILSYPQNICTRHAI